MGCSETFMSEQIQYPSLSPRCLYTWKTDFYYNSLKQEESLSLIAESTPWSIQNDVDWITMDQISGSGNADVNMTVAENKSGEDRRMGLFYIKSNASDFPVSIPVTVQQTGVNHVLYCSIYTITLDTENNSSTTTVTANVDWDYVTDATWLQLTRSGDDLLIRATEDNTTNDTRTAYVKVYQKSNPDFFTSVTVKQLPSSVTTSTDKISAPADGGVFEVKFNCKSSWRIQPTASYVSVTPSSGEAGDNTVQVEVAPNTTNAARTSSLSFYLNDVARYSIAINQEGYTLSLTKTNLYYDAVGGTQSVNVNTNSAYDWEVYTSYSWITLNPTKGTTKDPFSVTTLPNENTSNRTGNVYVQLQGTSITTTLNVTQYGNSQELSKKQLQFSAAASSQTVKLQSISGWKAQPSESWITVSPTESTTAGEFTVTVTANTGEEERTGTIEVTMGDKVETLTVTQQGSVLNISGNMEFTALGGGLTFSLTANGPWELSVEDDATWFRPDATSGEGSKYLVLHCDPNPTMTARSSALLVKNEVGQTLRLPVTQAGHYLRVDHTELLFFADGGTSEKVTFETDAAYKVTTPDSWLKVNLITKMFTVTATPNTGDQPRYGKVIVELTDIEDGGYKIEIPVSQLEPGGSFHRVDYGTENDYDQNGGQTTTIGFSPYGTDNNYDGSASSTSFTVRKLPTTLRSAMRTPTVIQTAK